MDAASQLTCPVEYGMGRANGSGMVSLQKPQFVSVVAAYQMAASRIQRVNVNSVATLTFTHLICSSI